MNEMWDNEAKRQHVPVPTRERERERFQTNRLQFKTAEILQILT